MPNSLPPLYQTYVPPYQPWASPQYNYGIPERGTLTQEEWMRRMPRPYLHGEYSNIQPPKPTWRKQVIGQSAEDSEWGNPLEELYNKWLYSLQEQRKTDYWMPRKPEYNWGGNSGTVNGADHYWDMTAPPKTYYSEVPGDFRIPNKIYYQYNQKET